MSTSCLNAEARSFALIEPFARHRVAIGRMLSAEGHSVQPLEELADFPASWLGRRIILMRDAPGLFAALVDLADRHHIWPRVVLYDDAPSASEIAKRINQGAIGYITTPQSAADIIPTLITDEHEGSFVSRIKWRVYQAERAMTGLTPREREVLSEVANGHSNGEIARLLKLSVRTVEAHRANLLHKLGFRSTAEAVRLTVERSLLVA